MSDDEAPEGTFDDPEVLLLVSVTYIEAGAVKAIDPGPGIPACIRCRSTQLRTRRPWWRRHPTTRCLTCGTVQPRSPR